MTRTLILGGARSGKSRHAEALAAASGKKIVYVATARTGDQEMAMRIAQHRQERDPEWTTVEEPMALGAVIERWSAPDCLILLDCMTIWLSNLLFDEKIDFPEIGQIVPPDCFHEQRAKLLHALKHAAGDVILVSNEVGMGIVPLGAVSRWFVDEAGRLNQELAAMCECAMLIVAGLPLSLKDGSCLPA
jgi:adenosylcobinamide kinase/adenosylcobinamide-phosphate guanylyltransferase